MAENTATKKSTSTPKKKTPAKAPAKKSAPAPTADLTIPVEVPSGVSVALGDEVYVVRPIKTTLGMSLAGSLQSLKEDPKEMVKAMDRLVNLVFNPEDRDNIKARLNDREDALDYNHIMNLLMALMERATGNPSTSPSV